MSQNNLHNKKNVYLYLKKKTLVFHFSEVNLDRLNIFFRIIDGLIEISGCDFQKCFIKNERHELRKLSPFSGLVHVQTFIISVSSC